nr:flagellar motor protein MotB [Ancylobacter gelatini]
MCRWRSWWKGLPPLALLVAAAVLLARDPVEHHLAARSETLLVDIGESWARARFEGRDALLEGEALSEEARIKVRAELGRLFGVRQVEDRTTLLPERRPFTFTAIRDGSKLHLEGYVPSRYARKRIAEAAEQLAPGMIVTGERELVRARGGPAGDFAGVVIFGLEQLAKMPAGRIIISDDSFSIEGRAPDFVTYDALEVTVRSELPADAKLARFAVLPPIADPFVWSAQREGDGVRLSGYIPLGDARRSLLDAVRGAVPGSAISDQLRLADGAPPTDGWLKAVSFALAQLGKLPDGKVTLNGTTIVIEGSARDFADYDALAGARRGVPEGYTLTRFAVEPPRVNPFVWSVLRGTGGLRLTGYAPSEDAKRLVLDAMRASFPGEQVSDEMRIGGGGPGPEDWVNATVFGVGQLGRLRTGAVQGKGSVLSISGEAQDAAAYAAVRAALEKAPPRGFSLARDVRPPVVSPYVFAMRKDQEGLTLSGFFPQSADHERLVVAAKPLLLGGPVNDVSAMAQGAPDGFTEAVRVTLYELARLDAGEARFDDGKLRLTGTALYPAAVGQIRDTLTAVLPPGFEVEVSLDVAPRRESLDTASCERAVADLLARGAIVFVDATAQLDPASRGLLDHVAAAAANCPDALISISVRARDGSAALTEARVKTLTTYLAQAGIAPERLITDTLGTVAVQAWPDGVPGQAGIQLIVR